MISLPAPIDIPDNQSMKDHIWSNAHIVAAARKISLRVMDDEAGVSRGTLVRIADAKKTVNYDTMHRLNVYLNGQISKIANHDADSASSRA